MTTDIIDPVTDTDWIARSTEIRPPSGLFIGGSERDAVAGDTRAVFSPRDGAKMTTVSWASAGDVDAAVAVARRAFDSGPWPRMSARERGDLLKNFADVLERNRSDLALLISLEMGKPIKDAYRIETRALVSCVRFYGELADQMDGSIPQTSDGELALVTREPAGVVGAVVPWNFPLTIAGWKFAPALAAGCTVVLKTSERSPLSMQLVARLGHEAGLPDGVLNVINGDGEQVGRRLGLHPQVDILTFTGSTEVGRHFLRYAADSNIKRVFLELGGKSPNIVMADAADLDAAADSAAWAIFFNSGQMCTAGSRLLLQEEIAVHVVDRIVGSVEQWAPADPLLASTRMGPLVDAAHLVAVGERLRIGVDLGASIRTGGRATNVATGGSYLEPTVFVADGNNPLVRREIFGPVLSVQTFRTEQEALALAGDTPYGLAAAVWTSDLGRAHRMSRGLAAGTVWVNCYEEGDMKVPFGGVKLSGDGRDKSRYALAEYTNLKTTWINYAS